MYFAIVNKDFYILYLLQYMYILALLLLSLYNQSQSQNNHIICIPPLTILDSGAEQNKTT